MKKLTAEQVARYRAALDRAYAGYKKLQKPDGSIGVNHAIFYNAYAMFYLCGDWAGARKLHDWCAANIIGSDGLHDTDTLRDNMHGDWIKRGTYLKAWFVYGAQMCGFYDQSLKVADSLMRFVDPELGGCYMDDDGRAGRKLLCFTSSGSVGRALLAVGKRYEATRVAQWMLRMINEQPDWETGFYEYMDAHTGKIVTDLDPVSPYYTKDDFDPQLFCYWNKNGPLGWAMFGPTTDFLASMFQMTGDRAYLDGMMKIFEFFYANRDYQSLTYMCSGKMLQGLPILYLNTGDERILDAIVTLCDYLVTVQDENGYWLAETREDYEAKGYTPEEVEQWCIIEAAATTADEAVTLEAVLKWLA